MEKKSGAFCIMFPKGNIKVQQLLIKEINYFKERNMKPNYSLLAKTHGVDRRTIKKYYINPNPTRKSRNWISSFDEYEEIIKQKAAVPGMTFSAIYHFLRNEKGLDKSVAYNTLTAFCRRKKITLFGKKMIPHVRYETAPGHQVQVDWKEDLKLKTKTGEVIDFNVFSATLGYSRKHIFIYSKNKTEQDFIKCANKMLIQYGGSVDEILTDNMSAIVSVSNENKMIRRKHQNILQWEKDSGISIKLCKVRTPETKGKDESANRFVNWLLPYDGEVNNEEDIIKAIQTIQNECNDKINDDIGVAPESLFQLKEKQALHPLPNMSLLESYTDGGMTQKVANTLLVPFQGRKYSVSADYIGKTVRVLKNDNTIEIYYNKMQIASHPFDELKIINYRKEDYIQGLAKSIGVIETPDLEKLAEENLKRF